MSLLEIEVGLLYLKNLLISSVALRNPHGNVIINGFIREKCDEYSEKYNLNFSCLATPAEGLSGRFTSIDKAIYGKIKGLKQSKCLRMLNRIHQMKPSLKVLN